MRIDGLIKYYDFKEMFEIKNSAAFTVFESFLSSATNWTNLETSHSYNNGKVFSGRINVWFEPFVKRQNLKQNVADIHRFFKNIETIPGVKINYSLTDYVLNLFSLRQIYYVMCGVDFRSDVTKSRLKFWFLVQNFPKKMAAIFKIHGVVDEVAQYYQTANGEYTLFGVELSFAGETRFKLYPYFTQDNMYKLYDTFDPKINSLIKKSDKVWITYDKGLNKVLYFQPKNMNAIIEQLGIDDVSAINEKYNVQGYKLFCISFLEKEILQDNPTKINLYC